MSTRVTVALSVLWTGFLPAQEFRATMSGVVVDAQGAVVAEAKIAATQTQTSANFQTLSGSDGQYTLPFLPPGDYRIVVEAPGFKRFVREGVRISTNERITLDVTLEVGAVTESVTVTADAPLLQTSTASSGQVINSRQIETMPMNGRTPLVLAQLSFGVVPSSDPRFYRPFDNAGPSTFSMGGTPANSNELLLDGSPDTTANGRVAYNPPVDAVDEVKVETFQVDAAYGHTGGGTVNVVMKSGTNALHGSAYEFNQVSNLAANQFFNNSTRQPRPSTRFNQYGLTVGGPLVIPKVVDGRNKLFFFFGYERVSDALPRADRATVPTPEQRNGDFSRLLSLGPAYQIYDPLTGVQEGDRIRRQPFAQNTIPAARISSIAKNYMQYYPQPNAVVAADGRDNLLIGQAGERNAFHNVLGRVDWNLNDRHKLFWNIRNNERAGKGINSLGYQVGESPAGGRQFKRENWGSSFDDVITFSPTTVLNTRLGWTRFVEGNTNLYPDFDITSLGLPAYIKPAARQLTLPRVTFGAYTEVGSQAAEETVFDIFQIFSSLTKIRGTHSMKFGTDLRLYRESSFNFADSAGRYDFRTQWTNGPLDSAAAAPIGQDFAAFLLGLPTGGQFDLNAHRTNQAGYWALFVQDDWRVRRNLTLNFGLRFEADLPTTERWDRTVVGFDFTSPNPVEPAARAAYARNPIPEIPAGQFRVPGGLLFAGSKNRNVYDSESLYVSPRLGISWSPEVLGPKTVLRAGFGLFVFAYGTTGINQPGFSQDTPLVASLDGFRTPAATLANPFPNGFDQPPGSSLGLATFNGRGVRFYKPQILNPYSVRWNFNIQRELGRNLVLEAGYMGNHSVHLQLTGSLAREWDHIPPQYLSRSGARDQTAINFLTANVANPFSGLLPRTNLNGSLVQRQQLLRGHPQFTSVLEDGFNQGNSYFHMFQVRLEKRYSVGLSLLANYQWSKLIERRSRLNEFEDFLEKRVAGEDRPQRFVMSAGYELPFGRGKAIGSSVHPIANHFIGGWIVNGIYTWQPGAPLNWGNVIYLGGDLNLNPRNVDRAFDTTLFNRNAAQQLQFNVRTFPTRFSDLRQDGANNFDFSVLKDFGIWERLKLQYRCEFFNGFNHPTFNPPDLSPTSGTFGKITFQANISRRIQMALRLSW